MNFLTAISRQMTRFTALIIVLASIIAFIEPATFSWVKGDTQVVVLGIIMLGMGTVSYTHLTLPTNREV